MDITVWSFTIFGSYRLFHGIWVFYKAVFIKKVYEYFSILLSATIILKAITLLFFGLYVQMSKDGHEWSKFQLNSLFVFVFGLDAYFRWVHGY